MVSLNILIPSVHTYTHIHTHPNMHIHTYTNTYIHTYPHRHIHTIYKHTYTYTCICMLSTVGDGGNPNWTKSWVNVHCWHGHNRVNDLSTSVHWEQQSPPGWGSEGWQSLPPGSECELSVREWPVCTNTSKCRFLLLDFHPETASTETCYWDTLAPPLVLCLIHTLRFQALLVADHSSSICTPQPLTPAFMHMCLCVCPFFISVPPQGRVPDPSLSAHGTLVVQTCIYPNF